MRRNDIGIACTRVVCICILNGCVKIANNDWNCVFHYGAAANVNGALVEIVAVVEGNAPTAAIMAACHNASLGRDSSVVGDGASGEAKGTARAAAALAITVPCTYASVCRYVSSGINGKRAVAVGLEGNGPTAGTATAKVAAAAARAAVEMAQGLVAIAYTVTGSVSGISCGTVSATTTVITRCLIFPFAWSEPVGISASAFVTTCLADPSGVCDHPVPPWVVGVDGISTVGV